MYIYLSKYTYDEIYLLAALNDIIVKLRVTNRYDMTFYLTFASPRTILGDVRLTPVPSRREHPEAQGLSDGCV